MIIPRRSERGIGLGFHIPPLSECLDARLGFYSGCTVSRSFCKSYIFSYTLKGFFTCFEAESQGNLIDKQAMGLIEF